jgi:hypothetical protein
MPTLNLLLLLDLNRGCLLEGVILNCELLGVLSVLRLFGCESSKYFFELRLCL